MTVVPLPTANPDPDDEPVDAELVDDETPAIGAAPDPMLLTSPLDATGSPKPILPDWLTSWAEFRSASKYHAGRHGHAASFHGVRSPVYALTVFAWAILGVVKAFRNIMRWWHWPEGWLLESQAVAGGRATHAQAMSAHTEGKRTRGTRGRILIVCVFLVVVAVMAGVAYLPRWAWVPIGITAVLGFAIYGKPAGRPLVQPASVPPEYAPPTFPIITQALYSLRIPAINEVVNDGRGITFLTDVHRDGEGWATDIDLPHGVTASTIIARREQLASGLRRPLSATWPEAVPSEHAGRMRLWIGYTDMAKVKPKPWPYLKAGQVNIFDQIPFATQPRGTTRKVPLFETNWLIGAAPGDGKTGTLRVLACAAALDPICDLWVHELAGKGDLHAFSRIAHRYCTGLDEEAVAYTAQSLAKLREELRRRSTIFKRLEYRDKPDGKLTRELAARRDLRLRPIVCVIDEVQNLFLDPTYSDQAIDDAAHVIRLGRAYGIILILATQRPDKNSLPTTVRDVMTARFCLKVPDQVSNDMILGTGAYKSGYDAVVFRHEIDAGLGWLRGIGEPEAVKTFYLDLPTTEKVIERARVMREQARVLSGYALGEDDTTGPRSLLADVLAVFGADDKLWCETIADRLASRMPDVYADITQAAVSDQLRSLGVVVKQVREPGAGPRAGCERDAVEARIRPVVADV